MNEIERIEKELNPPSFELNFSNEESRAYFTIIKILEGLEDIYYDEDYTVLDIKKEIGKILNNLNEYNLKEIKKFSDEYSKKYHWQYILDSLKMIHSGDCTGEPFSCDRCYAERILFGTDSGNFGKAKGNELITKFNKLIKEKEMTKEIYKINIYNVKKYIKSERGRAATFCIYAILREVDWKKGIHDLEDFMYNYKCNNGLNYNKYSWKEFLMGEYKILRYSKILNDDFEENFSIEEMIDKAIEGVE